MKLLIGGSPCTHWSIAQTKNRETEASGIGWELFLNYRIARDKYKPDYFLYENNKSMSPAIRAQITAELGVEPVLINSALVSAQNRQRLYWVGKRNPDGTYSQVPVEQPEDRGLLLRDILETGIAWQEKSYCITATEYKGSNPQQTLSKHRRTMVAEPVRIGTIENDAKTQAFDSQQYRVYSPDGKSVTLCGNGGGLGAKTGLYATPVDTDADGILHLGSLYGQHSRWGVFAKDGKCPTITASMGMGGGHVPMVPTRTDEEGHCQKNPTTAKQIYEVRDGKISIGNTWHPIKLRDGFYIIRKLTVRECMRLQTVPEEYVFPVSNSQAYKMLGNGWTVDVIAHIMSHFDGLTTEPVEVLSMYDGMSCGHIALDKLGATVATYYATEIDKYAVQTIQHNFPETIQLGDAFQVRDDDWRLGEEL
nr:MAG TPA: Cytosine specific methyltransferase [Caudoviricetes sp.]